MVESILHCRIAPVRLGTVSTRVQNSKIQTVGETLARGETTGLHGPLRSVCIVCQTNRSRYSCPRCNLPYCSVKCYQQHNGTCTEQFYEEHVMDNLPKKVEDKKKIEQILSRMKKNIDEEAYDRSSKFKTDRATSDLSFERLQQLSLRDSIKFGEDLTLAEQNIFLAELASGKLSRLVKPWRPWWEAYSVGDYSIRTKLLRAESPMIQVVGGNEGHQTVEKCPASLDQDESWVSCPQLPIQVLTLKDQNSLSSTMSRVKGPVSESLKPNCIEIAHAYALTMHTYNGDWTADPVDAAYSMLTFSSVLSECSSFSTIEEVMYSLKPKETSGNDTGTGGGGRHEAFLKHLVPLVAMKVFLVDMLCDSSALFKRAYKVVKTSRNRFARSADLKKQLFLAKKKIQFYLAWAMESSPVEFERLGISMNEELALREEYYRSITKNKE